MNTNTIVQKLWNYCNVLRDDGMSYGDYPSTSLRAGSEQLTYLLFLKMADERSRAPYNQASPVLTGYDWPSLVKKGTATKLMTLAPAEGARNSKNAVCTDLADCQSAARIFSR